MKELTKVIFKNAYRRDNVNKDITAKILSAFVFVIIFGTISSLMAFASYKLTNQLIEVDQAPAFINIILLIMIIFLFSRSVFESLNKKEKQLKKKNSKNALAIIYKNRLIAFIKKLLSFNS